MSKLKLALRRFPIAYTLVHVARWLRQRSYRDAHRALLDRLDQLRRQDGGILASPLGDGSRGVAVVLGWSRIEHVLAESVVRKALELAGYRPHVLSDPTPATRATYAALGVSRIESFSRYCPLPDTSKAIGLLTGISTFAELIELKWGGVSVGKYVASSLMRRVRKGSLNIQDKAVRKLVIDGLARSIAFVTGAERMLQEIGPAAVVEVDRGYSPYGEIFDVCINRGVPLYTWNAAHRDNTIMLKRYHRGNADNHPSSLSPSSWQRLMVVPWGERERALLKQELAEAYSSGEWYAEVGTQFGKKACSKSDIAAQLGLDPGKKTAAIFAHIFWDATFFWGKDLFRDYEEWFIEAVRAACSNDSLNWLVKVHPANLIKDKRDGVATEPSEVLAVRERIGQLPPHVKLIPADTDISTYSLFEVIDYCLTVRGTVGMEAALMGRSVLTAGTGRYDHHGFTHDFESPADYLVQLTQLGQLAAPTAEMRELAERYAYGVFLCRPVRLRCFDLRFRHDAMASLVATCKARSVAELRQAPELVAISDWLQSGEEDFIMAPQFGTESAANAEMGGGVPQVAAATAPDSSSTVPDRASPLASGDKAESSPIGPPEWTAESISGLWEYYSTLRPETYFTAQFGEMVIDKTAAYLPDGPVCDFGCGTGFLLDYLLQTRQAAGFDFTEKSLDVARNRLAGNTNLIGLFELKEIDKVRGMFSSLYFVETVEHLLPSNLVETFDLLHALLKPGGVLICTTPNDQNLADSEVFYPVTRKYFHRYQHVSSFTEESLADLFRQQGFEVLHTFTTDFSAKRLLASLKVYVRPILGKKNPHLMLVARKPGGR